MRSARKSPRWSESWRGSNSEAKPVSGVLTAALTEEQKAEIAAEIARLFSPGTVRLRRSRKQVRGGEL